MTSPSNPTPERGGYPPLPPPTYRGEHGEIRQPLFGPHNDPSRPIQPPVVAAPKPKRKRRVFMWVFLAVQVLFLVWAITGAASANGQPTDCGSLSAEDCNAASDIGTGIGVAIIIGAWFFVDVFLGVGYAVYRLAKRPDR